MGEAARAMEGAKVYDKVVFDINQIMEILPHRYPFLMVDRIVEFDEGARIVGVKNVSVNEEFFQGHFPGNPVMPGVLILESMAQTGAIMAKKSPGGIKAESLIYLVGVDGAKWKKIIQPGDQMIIEMRFIKKKGPLWIMDGTVKVDGKVAAEATLRAAEG